MTWINLWPSCSFYLCVIVIHFHYFRLSIFVAKWLTHALSELDSIVCTCYLLIFSFLLCLFLLYRPAQLKSHRSVSTSILLVLKMHLLPLPCWIWPRKNIGSDGYVLFFFARACVSINLRQEKCMPLICSTKSKKEPHFAARRIRTPL